MLFTVKTVQDHIGRSISNFSIFFCSRNYQQRNVTLFCKAQKANMLSNHSSSTQDLSKAVS